LKTRVDEQRCWNAHIKRYPPNGRMTPHRHDEPWFCVVLAGGYEEHIRSAAHDHAAGDMLFYPAHALHAQRFGPAGSVKVLFTPSSASLSYLAAHRLPLSDAPFVRSRQVARIGARLAAEIKLDDRYSSLAIEGLTLELMAAFCHSGQGHSMASVPVWLARVREALEDGTDDTITLEDLARLAKRHPVHVAREFRRYYGHTVGNCLRRKRLGRAAFFLRGSTMPLAEIALVCGYGGQAAFTRAFKTAYGVTPAAFRALSH